MHFRTARPWWLFPVLSGLVVALLAFLARWAIELEVTGPGVFFAVVLGVTWGGLSLMRARTALKDSSNSPENRP